MNIVEYADREMLEMSVADALASDLENCLLSHETASFAVPGGTTPGPIFDSLCAVDLDWSRVHVLLSDERWVPEDHERSNTRLVRERLLTGKAAAAQYVPLYRRGVALDEAVGDVAQSLVPELPISVLMLGMGGDMHTASLFPGGDRLSEGLSADAPAALPMRVDGQPEDRITLTAPVLNGALNKHLVIIGQDKKDALDRALDLPYEEAPIAAVLSGMTVHWAK